MTPAMLFGSLLLLVSAPAGAAKGPAFMRQPAATRTADGVRITFAVDRPTDVAVYVEDPQGKVIRHLVAGMLGPNPPAPLKPNALEQTILWDGLSDAGQPAGPGPFRVRVALGLDLTPTRLFTLDSTMPAFRAVAVGPGGELFALGTLPNFHSGDATPAAVVFDRQGRYRRTIMPWPADLPPERTAGFGVINVPGQGRIPFVHHGENRSFYPYLREPDRGYPVVTQSGTLLFADGDGQAGGYTKPGPVHLMRIQTDGGCPPEGFLGARLAVKGTAFPALALSPDEKTLYVTGVQGEGVIWRLALPAAEKAEVFARDLDDPRGLAVDGAGRVLVAERGKNRIRAFKPDGTPAGEVAVDQPDGIAVHRRTGAIYALTGEFSSALVKLDGLADDTVPRTAYSAEPPEHRDPSAGGGAAPAGKPLRGVRARLDFRVGAAAQKHANRRPVLALDQEAERPILWVASLCGYSGWQLRRLEDEGEAFGEAREVVPEGPARLLSEISLHPDGGPLLLRRGGLQPAYATLDPQTGAVARLTVPYPQKLVYHGEALTFGRDGYLYLQTRGTVIEYDPAKGLYRYTADLKLAPWPGGRDPPGGVTGARVHGTLLPHLASAGHLHTTEGSLHMLARGMDTNVRGQGAMLIETRSLARRGVYHILTFGPDGQVTAARAVSGLPGGGTASVRIDNAANLYVADASKPYGHIVRPEFRPQVPETRKLPDGRTNWYPVMSGSIIKFPPTGGAIGRADSGVNVTIGYGGDDTSQVIRHPDDGRERTLDFGGTARLTGALWQREVVSLVPVTGGTGGAYYCSCEQLRFHVDGFGRVFAPDTLRFQLAVLDTNGNELGRFGTYGNLDAQRAGGAALRFAWPRLVAGDNRTLYIGDSVNGTILGARMAYRAEAEALVKE